MDVIPGWDGPVSRPGRDQMCYWRIAGQRPGQSSEERRNELFNQGALPKRMFIKVQGSRFSGGSLVMPDFGELLQSPKSTVKLTGLWEVVKESGKWRRYNLDVTLTSSGDISPQWRRQGAGVPLDINVETIKDMAAWLENQIG